MAAEHTVKLTLDELVLVREILVDSRTRLGSLLTDEGARREIYEGRGAEGRKEWGEMQKRYALLESAIIAL